MRKWLYLVVLSMFMLVFFQAQPGFTQTSEEIKGLKEDIKSLKDGQAAIQRDLQEIKKLVASRPAAQQPAEFKEAIINIEGAPLKGEKQAKLVLMEFSDYQ